MSVTLIRRALRASLIGVVAIMSAALFVAPAAADTTTLLRLAHLSPDTPPVDVYVASVTDPSSPTVVLEGVGYGQVSAYQTLPSGPYLVSMRPAGAAVSTPAVISTTLEAGSGSAYTVAGVGTFAELGLKVLDDDLTLPPEGQARARVIQAAASEPTLDVAVVGGQTLGRDVDFASTTPYRNVGAGVWTLRVSADNETIADLPITVEPGAVYSVLILDTPAGLTVALQVDALSTGVVPEGGVETGAGGLASGRNAVLPAALGLSTLLGLALFLPGALHRWQPRSRISRADARLHSRQALR